MPPRRAAPIPGAAPIEDQRLMAVELRPFAHVPYERTFWRPVTRLVLAVGILVGACARGETQSAVSSIYTDLMGSNCTSVRENRDTGATVHRCAGVGGWNLLVLYDDQRMSVTVVAPDGKESALVYWDTISRGFTSLGPRAEWRVRSRGGQAVTPVALIVRVNASDVNGDGQSRSTSYLAVARIGAAGACVIGKIPPSADANEQARRTADATTAPCVNANQE